MPCRTVPEQADLVVLNTCHIREKASEKVYSELGRLRDLKAERRAEGRDLTIAVAGCVAQAEGEEIIRRQPAVDIVVGPQAYHRLPELLARAARKAADTALHGRRRPGAGVLDTEFPAESKFDHLPAPRADVRAGSAFLSIQEGCDKFCTFCVVPYTRGAEYSRPAAAVLAEARAAGGGGRDRDHAARPERQRLSRRGCAGRVDLVAGAPDPGAGRDRWPGAHPLHHLPSARHGRRSDRRAWRRAAAHALPAPAGAVGLGPHPRGDEPPARPRPLSAGLSTGCAPRGPTSRCRPTSSSAFRARATPISTTRCGWSTRSASPRPSPSSTAAGRARPARRWATRSPRAVKVGAARRAAGAARPSRRELQRLQGRHHRAGAVRRGRPQARPDASARRPWLQSVYVEGGAG